MTHRCSAFAIALFFAISSAAVRADEAFVPGSGMKVKQVGDNFEDSKWS